jgi:hypothetical protein
LYIDKKPVKKKLKKKGSNLVYYMPTVDSVTELRVVGNKKNVIYLLFWFLLLLLVLSNLNSLLFFFTNLTVYDIENLILPSHNLINFSIDLKYVNSTDMFYIVSTENKLKTNEVSSSSIFTIKNLICI